MKIFRELLSGKNAETVAKTLEECVEKLVQYGTKQLKVMKPEIIDYAYLNGGGFRHMKYVDGVRGAVIGHVRRIAKKVYVTDIKTGEKKTLEIVDSIVMDGIIPRGAVRKVVDTSNGRVNRKSFESLAELNNRLCSGSRNILGKVEI